MPGHIYTHLSPNGASHPGLDFGLSFVFGSFVISIFSMLSVALSQTLFSYGKRPRLGVSFPNFSQTPFPGGTRGFAVLTFFSSSCSFFLQFCVLTVYPRLSFTTGYVDSGTLWISLRRSNNLRADRQIRAGLELLSVNMRSTAVQCRAASHALSFVTDGRRFKAFPIGAFW